MTLEAINPFVKEPSYYTRKVDILKGYKLASATYLHSKHPQFSLDYCLKYVGDQMKAGGTNELRDPRVMFISQRKRGNRAKEVSTLSALLNEIVNDQNLMLSPALIAYQRPEVVKSLLSEFLFGNVKKRKDYKNLMFKYEREGNKTLQTFYNILQSSVKELNNSLSGAGVSKFNAIYCKSSHLSLTSGCRTATSYANASNERFIAGNRHYHKHNVVLQELSNAVLYGPHKEIMDVANKYGIVLPSVEQTMECILKSSRKYWRDNRNEAFILDYIKTMSPAARAAFCYTGDAYHLSKFNPGFVEAMFEEFIDTSREYAKDEIVGEDILGEIDGDKVVTVSLFKSNLMVGKGFKGLKENHPDVYDQVNTTAYNFENKIHKYEDLIDALWRPRYLPSSIGKFRSIIREAVLTSDTDSTIFTTMYWTEKVTGTLDFCKKSYNVGYLVVYFASQIVSNALSILCANMGIGVKQLDMLQMKNEYYFPIYGLTNISKHYFALRSAQEGVIKAKLLEDGTFMETPELEMKGVHLISSKASIQFMVDFQEYIEHHILGQLLQDKDLRWDDVMEKPIKQELNIRHNIRSGEVDYYSREQIKDPRDYKQGADNSNYFQYLLWREVFAYKYGDVDNPPLYAVKIPVDLSKPRKLKAWITQVKEMDMVLGNRLDEFLATKDKSQFTSILIPQQIVDTTGLPKEILPVIDEARAVSQIMTPYYIALQTFGLYVGNTKNTRLLSDPYIDEFMQKANGSLEQQQAA